jgi:hypothetical protein
VEFERHGILRLVNFAYGDYMTFGAFRTPDVTVVLREQPRSRMPRRGRNCEENRSQSGSGCVLLPSADKVGLAMVEAEDDGRAQLPLAHGRAKSERVPH